MSRADYVKHYFKEMFYAELTCLKLAWSRRSQIINFSSPADFDAYATAACAKLNVLCVIAGLEHQYQRFSSNRIPE